MNLLLVEKKGRDWERSPLHPIFQDDLAAGGYHVTSIFAIDLYVIWSALKLESGLDSHVRVMTSVPGPFNELISDPE